MSDEPEHHRLRKAAGVLGTVLVAAVGVIGVLLFFAARDQAPVSKLEGPGQEFADQGSRHVRPGEAVGFRYNSNPPTSGPHVAVPVRRAASVLSTDQILHALESGNVILVYGDARPPAVLATLAQEEGGSFAPALAGAGQAVILARRPGMAGVTALAWRHLYRTPAVNDPELRRFVEFWLGRGRSSGAG